jgi:hypothetical protein
VSTKDEAAARAAVLRAYGVRPDEPTAARLAQAPKLVRKSATELVHFLEFLAMRDWETHGLSGDVLKLGLSSWLIPRVLFAERHGCGAHAGGCEDVMVYHV